MKLLIHDLEKLNENKLLNNRDEITVISDNGKIKPCICCYGCWIKTPGKCIIDDGYNNMGMLLSKCNQLIVISKCFYGGYSPFVKNVFDRSVCPYLLPYFKTKNGETHHPKRYKNTIALSVHFYGKISETEKETAKKLIVANGNNLFQKTNINFYDTFDEIKGG
jgi:multimeric flavodoxin WrbA